MNSHTDVKNIVKEKYGEIARQQKSCGCGCSSQKVVEYSMMNDDYSTQEGYVADADMGLGCGLPTQFAEIKQGDTVLDLGSGAGNDVFVARSLTGPSGKVIGIDMTPEMVEKANQNKQKLGFENVEFHLGEIESMPLENNSVDVVVSNCVLNLVPDKEKAFREIYRVVKPGGHFSISDIVIQGELSPSLLKSAEMYAGCVAGALQKQNYLEIIRNTGFKNIEIKKSKTIELPDSLLSDYLTAEEIDDFKKRQIGIFSVTVFAEK